MIELDIPSLSMQYVVLKPDLPAKKGVPKNVPPLEQRVQLGTVVSGPITERTAAKDPELLEFLKEQKGKFSYHRVHLVCSFEPIEGEAFTEARLEVELQREDDIKDPMPIAWSMDPRRTVDLVQYKEIDKLTSTLKFIGSELGDEKTVKIQEEAIAAFRELRHDPYWIFSKTEARRIFGSYRCRLVVQVPFGVITHGTVSLSTILQRKALKLFPYRADVPPTAPISFTIHG